MRTFVRFFALVLATCFAMSGMNSFAEEPAQQAELWPPASPLSSCLVSPLADYDWSPGSPQDMARELDALGVDDHTPQISVEVRFIEVDEENISTFRKQPGVTWNTSTHGALPKMNPIATNKRSGAKTSLEKTGFSIASIAASSTTVMSRPVSTALLDEVARKKTLNFLNSGKNTNVLQAPRVTLFSGQVATIGDGSTRPFVEAVDTIKGQHASANQPVIRTLEEGVLLRLQAIADETDESRSSLRLNGDLAMSEILDVETFTYTESGSGQEITVQIPQLKINQVHFSKELLSGQSLLIDPYLTITEKRTEKGFFGLTTTTKKRRLVLLTPVWLDLSDAIVAK